ATRDNRSYYAINGTTSSYTEVTTLLRSRGIDLDHKRFLILQGEVESIAQMKPKAQNEHEDGLLEYLEDIIGTSRYKQAIADAQCAHRSHPVAAQPRHRPGPQALSHSAGRGRVDCANEAEGAERARGRPSGVSGGHHRHVKVQAGDCGRAAAPGRAQRRQAGA